MLSDLNPGASAEQIRELESALGLTIPDSFRASLAVHNGENDGWPCKVFADRGAYLSTSRIVDEWKQRQQFGDNEDLEDNADELIEDNIITLIGPVKPKMFLAEWLPILECNGDVFWAIDFSPADGGTIGQVIEVDWESCSWKVVANSFVELLESYVVDLEAGRYVVRDGVPTARES
jgi:cell wall assembly regulator SMI1